VAVARSNGPQIGHLTFCTHFAYSNLDGRLALVRLPFTAHHGAANGLATLDYDFGDPDTDRDRADMELTHRRAVLRGLHILGAGPNTMGQGALRRLMQWAKEQRDVDELRIEGATRTSGVHPGQIPRPFDV
jgi:hypothetical protein